MDSTSECEAEDAARDECGRRLSDMISLPGHTVLHVIGRARPGDPTTAAARALCRRLDRIGRPGRPVSLAPAHGLPDVAPPAAAARSEAQPVGKAEGSTCRTG